MLLLLQFRQGFAGLRIPVLAARIGELVSMGELYQDLIAAPASNMRTGTETGSPIPADTIIFRP
jgi:hypothetical protein